MEVSASVGTGEWRIRNHTILENFIYIKNKHKHKYWVPVETVRNLLCGVKISWRIVVMRPEMKNVFAILLRVLFKSANPHYIWINIISLFNFQRVNLNHSTYIITIYKYTYRSNFTVLKLFTIFFKGKLIICHSKTLKFENTNADDKQCLFWSSQEWGLYNNEICFIDDGRHQIN